LKIVENSEVVSPESRRNETQNTEKTDKSIGIYFITEFQNTNLKYKNKEPHTYKLARPQTPYSGTRSEAISTDPSAGKIFVFVSFR